MLKPNENAMIDTTRRIAAGVGTIPEATTITGSITVSADNNSIAIYTGNITLSDYITQGNSGFMGYCYIYCEDTTTKVAKVTGTTQLTSTTWAIFTDGNMTGASLSVFGIISQPIYGYSYLNDGGATVQVDGVNVLNNEGASYPPPAYADGYNFGETRTPLHVDATSSSVLITEVLGAPATT